MGSGKQPIAGIGRQSRSRSGKSLLTRPTAIAARHQHIEAVALRRATFRPHQALNALEGIAVRRVLIGAISIVFHPLNRLRVGQVVLSDFHVHD
jgi:hypothetical protein